jgi:hypothetical protein
MVMVFNTTVDIISVMSWRLVLLVEETGVYHHCRHYFSYVVAVSFSGGGNWCLTPLSTLFQLCRGG